MSVEEVMAMQRGNRDKARQATLFDSTVMRETQMLGLRKPFPPLSAFLGVPIVFQGRVYGWLCLANKLGSDAFSDVDERLAVTLWRPSWRWPMKTPACSARRVLHAQQPEEV
jgi:hypothetical protein